MYVCLFCYVFSLNLVDHSITEHDFVLKFQFVQHGLDFTTAVSANLSPNHRALRDTE